MVPGGRLDSSNFSSGRGGGPEQENRRLLAWRVFFDASTRLQGVLETHLKEGAEISLSDYNILSALIESPAHSLRMGDLAARLGYSPSRLTYLVSGLVKEGWVIKRPSGDDGRGFVAALTENGVERTNEATRIHQDTVRRLLLDDLTDAHIDMIVEAFEYLEAFDTQG